MKKILPYGAELSFLIKNGYKPNEVISVFIGQESWVKGYDHYLLFPISTLVLPPYLCPKQYFWPVKNCNVFVRDTGYCPQDYLDDLFLCLIEHGCPFIAHLEKNDQLTFYK